MLAQEKLLQEQEELTGFCHQQLGKMEVLALRLTSGNVQQDVLGICASVKKSLAYIARNKQVGRDEVKALSQLLGQTEELIDDYVSIFESGSQAYQEEQQAVEKALPELRSAFQQINNVLPAGRARDIRVGINLAERTIARAGLKPGSISR